MASRRNQHMRVEVAVEKRFAEFKICGHVDADGVIWEKYQTGPHEEFGPDPAAGWYMYEFTHENFGEIGVPIDLTCNISDPVKIACGEDDEPVLYLGSSKDLAEQYALVMSQDISAVDWSSVTHWTAISGARGLSDFGSPSNSWGAWRNTEDPDDATDGEWSVGVSLHFPVAGFLTRSEGRLKVEKTHWKAPIRFKWKATLRQAIDETVIEEMEDGEYALGSADIGEFTSEALFQPPATASPSSRMGVDVYIHTVVMRAPDPEADEA